MSTVLFIILAAIIIYDLFKAVFNKDKSMVWSPLVFLAIYLTYYILFAFLRGGGDASEDEQALLLTGGIVFYIAFKISFRFSMPQRDFKVCNTIVNPNNAKKVALLVFVIAFLGYASFRGITLSVFSTESRSDMVFNDNDSYNHADMYITYLISTFCFSCALLYAAKRKMSITFFIFIALSLIVYIISGFRYRILILFIVVLSTIYLFPSPRKINFLIIIPFFLFLYLMMGVLERTRMYGIGLDVEALSELRQSSGIEESRENIIVYEFSSKVMSEYGVRDFIYFEPLENALCMPLPRSLFPWKPKGLYLREAAMRIYGTITQGNAFLNITEAYISFGWFGIILYGVFLGWLSKVFWNNYRRNQNMLGAILLLALFNGALYQIIARGYMAQALTTFIYYVFVPFWITMLLVKLKIIRQ